MSFRLCLKCAYFLSKRRRLGRTVDGVHFFISAVISHDVRTIWNGRFRRLGPFLLFKLNSIHSVLSNDIDGPEKTDLSLREIDHPATSELEPHQDGSIGTSQLRSNAEHLHIRRAREQCRNIWPGAIRRQGWNSGQIDDWHEVRLFARL